MAGHNQWSKVKHLKARVDARDGNLFGRFRREIMNVFTNTEISDEVLAQFGDGLSSFR